MRWAKRRRKPYGLIFALVPRFCVDVQKYVWLELIYYASAFSDPVGGDRYFVQYFADIPPEEFWWKE